MSGLDVGSIAEAATKIRENIEAVIVGKSDVVELLLVSILAEGHVLIEDVPGIGKTMLAKSVARSLDCSFHRIQCTPDLLPSDITGSHIFNQQTGDFEFRKGPVFAQIILADEINRATPRSQSALLESMEEHQVTQEGETFMLPRPFIVLATQNPIELEGTFPLPEAQLDRFLMRIHMGYTTEAEDRLILERFSKNSPVEELTPVVSGHQVVQLQKACRDIMVSHDVQSYIIAVIRSTRIHAKVELGGSTRAMMGLYRASQSLAAIRDRTFVIPDDVKYLAPFVLSHRIIPKVAVSLKGGSAKDIVRELLDTLSVPINTSHYE